ncbi:unnamed protein product [Mesocestoides corti]|uniref:ADP-ribosylation factor-like protein 6-interacting protein 1 n=1 Tax=Mesocestoides corti TaxID=53468 RepID=A0A3P6HX86_MESCO|nr:unnamed protein product [Mesocestoides corti]
MPMSQVEVCGSDVVRLMADLKDWEKLFVQFECVLTWEKPLVLLYTFISITVFYAFLWLFEPPLLVSLGCLTLTFSLWFYFGPKFALKLLPTVPLAEHNQRYRAFCRRILRARRLFILIFQHLSNLRKQRPYIYTVVCLSAIVTAEILTYNYDGILIAYILTICALLTPGIRHTGVIRIFYLVVKKSLRFIWRIISQLILFLYRLIPATSRDSGQLTEGAAMTK